MNLAGPSKTSALSTGTDTLKTAPYAVQSIVQRLPRSKYDLTVEWQGPTNLNERGGYDTVTYDLYMSVGDSNDYSLLVRDIADSFYTYRDAVLGETYTFRIETVAE